VQETAKADEEVNKMDAPRAAAAKISFKVTSRFDERTAICFVQGDNISYMRQIGFTIIAAVAASIAVWPVVKDWPMK